MGHQLQWSSPTAFLVACHMASPRLGHLHLPAYDIPHSCHHHQHRSSPRGFTLQLPTSSSQKIFSGEGRLHRVKDLCAPYTSLFKTSQGTHENLSHSHITSCAFITELLGLKVSILSSQLIFQSKPYTFIYIHIQKFSLYSM